MYYVILGVPGFLSLITKRKVNVNSLLLVYLFLVVVVGFRYHVGTDWNNYLRIHDAMLSRNLIDVLMGPEPLSLGLFWWSSHYGGGVISTNVAGAIIMLTGIFALARRTPAPWLSIIAATPYLIIVAGMSGVRQVMATGIVFFSFSIWRHSGAVVRSLSIVVASLFHVSALSMIVFVLLETRLNVIWKTLGGAVVVIGGFSYLEGSTLYGNSIAFYTEHYVMGDELITSPGALLHLLLIWIPAGLFLLFRQKLRHFIENPALATWGAIFALLLLPAYFVSSTGASRMTIYLYFVPMLIYPSFIFLFRKAEISLAKAIFVVVHFVVLAAWLNFANNSKNHIPYQNYLFLDSQSQL